MIHTLQEDGPIDKPKSVADVKQEPYALPDRWGGERALRAVCSVISHARDLQPRVSFARSLAVMCMPRCCHMDAAGLAIAQLIAHSWRLARALRLSLQLNILSTPTPTALSGVSATSATRRSARRCMSCCP